MRTDLIGAYIIKDWLDKFTPDVSKGWQISFEADIQTAARSILTHSEVMQRGYVAQNMLAWAAIERWHLQDVSLLAGGTPTPISPIPGMVRFFTDANPAVVEEARNCGYKTMQVDISVRNDLAKLNGTQTLIGTGLMHFIDDQKVTAIFELLENLDIRSVVFNNGDLPNGPEFDAFLSFFQRIGRPLFIRSVDQMSKLPTAGWKLAEVGEISNMLPHMGIVGQHLWGMPNLFNTYQFVRA